LWVSGSLVQEDHHFSWGKGGVIEIEYDAAIGEITWKINGVGQTKIAFQATVPVKFGVGGGNNANKWTVLEEHYQQLHSPS
jgi:hypothetical protein